MAADVGTGEQEVSGSGWLTVGQDRDPELEQRIALNAQKRMQAGKYSEEDYKYIKALSLNPVEGKIHISQKQLETLRRQCQLWDVKIEPGEISSHRPLVGKFIVLLKRVLFPILQVLLRDFVRQQRAFNAATITVCTQIINDLEELKSEGCSREVV